MDGTSDTFDESVTLLEDIASALADGRFTPAELVIIAVALAKVIRSVLVIFKQPVVPASTDVGADAQSRHDTVS